MSTLSDSVLKRKREETTPASKKLKGSVEDTENINPNKKTSKIPVLKLNNSTLSTSSNSSTNLSTITTPTTTTAARKPPLQTTSSRTSTIRANATSKINTRPPTSTTTTQRTSIYNKKPPTTNLNNTMMAPSNARQYGSISRVNSGLKKPQPDNTKIELEQTKTQLVTVEEENKDLKEKIDEQSLQLKDLVQLEERAKCLTNQATKYHEENIQLKSINKTQEIELGALRTVQEKLQTDNIEYRVKVSTLEKEIDREKKQAEMEKATLKVQYESEIRIQKEQFEHQIVELTEIKDKEHNLTKERLNKEISRVKTELDRVQVDLNYSVEDANAKAEKISNLEEIIRQQAEQIQTLESKRHKDENERRRLHNLIQELKGNIRVYCRVKPAQDIKCIAYPDNDVDERSINIQEENRTTATGNVSEGKKYFFQFDKVFRPNSSQKEIFYEISQLVQSALDGFKVCIFAYGQTGSGKTYTMEGPPKDVISKLEPQQQQELSGMIPRSVDQIFETADQLKEKGWTFSIVASFLEIYNENIRDLLDSANKEGTKYEIKHSKDGSTSVTGLKYVPVDRPERVQELLKIACKNRAVAATNSNERSSRSHSVFTLQITGRNENTDQTTQGVLNLVDLAGSERIGNSNTTGERLKETQSINLSLTCLSSVVTALSNKASFIPYRDSKLTYLLQNCLGGESKTLMFVNIDPENVNETVQSLRFASKVNACEVHASRKIK